MAGLLLDAHVHLWDWQLDGYEWMTDEMVAIRRPFTLDDLWPELDRHGVAGIVLVQTCPSVEETRLYLTLAAAEPEVAGVVGWLDLTDPAMDEALASLRDRHQGRWLVGIRHQVHDEDDPDWLDRDEVRRGIAAVGRHGLVYDLLVRTRELRAAVRLVEDLADQRFVLDHLAKPSIATGEREPWAHHLRRLAAAPNVACKLSGMVTEADWQTWRADDLRPYAATVLEAFGPDRVLFGSDWPVCTLAASYTEVVEAAAAMLSDLTETERDRVFRGTAAEVYGLTISH